MNIKFIYSFFIGLFFSGVIIAQPQRLVQQPFSSTVGTLFVCFDGSRAVFKSYQNGNWELFYCDRSGDNNWSEPKHVDFENNAFTTGNQIFDPSLNAMGDVMYFAAQNENSQGGTDIYYSRFNQGKWSTPENFAVINSPLDESAPMISADANYFFFVRKIPGAKDDEFTHKIFYTRRDENQKWKKPLPLADKINASDENYPFFCEDNTQLYFASKRDKDPEGYNLYGSAMLAENIWFDPEPITILNTDNDDIRISKIANTNKLFYSQILEKRKTIEGGIYLADIPEKMQPKKVFEFKGTITDVVDNKPLEGTVIVRYSDNMDQVGEQSTQMPDASYQFYFTQGRALEFEFFAKNYSHYFYEYDAGFNTAIPKEPVINNVQLFNSSILQLNVFDEEIFEPLKGEVKIFDANNNDVSSGRIESKGNGRYELNLDIGTNYTIKVTVPNYEDYQFDFDLSGVVQYNEFEKDIELTPSKTPFEINIADVETDQAIDEVEIVITNLEKNETIVKKVRKDENGKFIVDLRDGDKYEINVNGPKGYAFYNTKVDMASTENKKLDVKLTPLKAKTKLVLNNITFETNSAELNASSYEELDRVVKLLIDNPDINIEISAHTDDVGSTSYNQKLSLKRAQSVVDYLVGNNLSVERLIAKGYGESNPLVPNTSEENRAQNRRVELKIVDINETSGSNE